MVVEVTEDSLTTEDVVSSYQTLMNAVVNQAKGKGEHNVRVARALNEFKAARVFAVPPTVYESSSTREDMPENLPFSGVLILLAPTYPMPRDMVLRLDGGVDNGIESVRIGRFVLSNGDVWTCDIARSTKEGTRLLTERIRWRGVWDKYAKRTKDAVLIPAIIRAINAHQTVMDPASRKATKKAARKTRRGGPCHIPPSLYFMTLAHKIVDHEIMKPEPKDRQPQQYRSDVRGHLRIRVARGTLPLGEEKRADLLAKKYSFVRHPIIDDLAVNLLNRGVSPPAEGEWMAIKKTWVKPYVRGPESAPYIPAVRVVAGV